MSYTNFRGLLHMRVTRVGVKEGDGKDSIVRVVNYYYDEKGNQLWKDDPCPESIK